MVMPAIYLSPFSEIGNAELVGEVPLEITDQTIEKNVVTYIDNSLETGLSTDFPSEFKTNELITSRPTKILSMNLDLTVPSI